MKILKIHHWSGVLTIVILAGLLIFSLRFSHIQPALARESLSNFPYRIGSYRGTDLEITEAALQVLSPTEVLIRSYMDPQGNWMSLYIPFFEAQNDRSRIHSPKSCMVGGGFAFRDLKPYKLRYHEKEVTVNWVLTEKDGAQQIVLYWIQSQGRVMRDEYISKLYLILDAINRGRTDGSLVRCITPVKQGESVTDATRRVAEFAQMVMEEITKFIPD